MLSVLGGDSVGVIDKRSQASKETWCMEKPVVLDVKLGADHGMLGVEFQ